MGEHLKLEAAELQKQIEEIQSNARKEFDKTSSELITAANDYIEFVNQIILSVGSTQNLELELEILINRSELELLNFQKKESLFNHEIIKLIEDNIDSKE